MGMNWLSRSVSFAESIASGPKPSWNQGPTPRRDRCLSLHSDDCDRWRPWWAFPSPLSGGDGGQPRRISIRDRNLEEALDHGCHLLRYLELMKVACADGHADVDVRFER